MAEKEENGLVSVGGLVTRIDPKAFATDLAERLSRRIWSQTFPAQGR